MREVTSSSSLNAMVVDNDDDNNCSEYDDDVNEYVSYSKYYNYSYVIDT